MARRDGGRRARRPRGAAPLATWLARMVRWRCVAIAAVLAACAAEPTAPGHVPGPAAAGRPGDILQSEPFPGAPAGAAATRLRYVSTTPVGEAVAVSALVIVPAAAPAGERPVVAWVHPTTGVAPACAPTLGPQPFGQIQGLSDFLAAGSVVVATDYPGLGGPGVHPYLVGSSEARAALDSVRAVRRLPEAQAGRRFAVWGHSQGGHAALFTARLAGAYAPELELVGVAAAAPVTDVAALIERPGDDPLWGGLVSYTVWSWSRVFGLDPDGILRPATGPTIARAAADCLQSGAELARLEADAAPLRGQAVTPRGRWEATLRENAAAPWAGAPVLLAQGGADPVIPPALTRDFARRLCRAGTKVRYLAMPGVDHYTIGMRTAGAAAAWIADRFAGRPPPDDCGTVVAGR